MTLTLVPGDVSLATLRRLWAAPQRIAIDAGAKSGVDAAAATVARVVADHRTVYGVNTGFGLLARTRIDDTRLAELQRALLLSHAAGTGPPIDDAVVRLVLVLKAASLARGHSGVRWVVIEALLALANANVLPCVPLHGSVGASGDLAPLAHLAGVLIGEGEARVDGRIVPAAAALAHAKLAPLVLAPKEGLALINGTQVSTALALAGLFAFERALAAAFVAGAMSVDACLGSDTPFDARIHALRGHAGQRDAAAIYRRLLAGSAIRASHVDCPRVQDPYSLRCQPQVMGAVLDQTRATAATLVVEANAVSDNPLVFAASGDVLSGGNFHAEAVAFAADNLALAIAEAGALAERRAADRSSVQQAPWDRRDASAPPGRKGIVDPSSAGGQRFGHIVGIVATLDLRPDGGEVRREGTVAIPVACRGADARVRAGERHRRRERAAQVDALRGGQQLDRDDRRHVPGHRCEPRGRAG
ncbi:MAG TPA: aromatic amino acid lyase, partial [Casimicrobiaceae bacterium]|nr:aromatic amino acid lyase [Casimicrobiaceae bacterium]